MKTKEERSLRPEERDDSFGQRQDSAIGFLHGPVWIARSATVALAINLY
jgi:hypothetical protein